MQVSPLCTYVVCSLQRLNLQPNQLFVCFFLYLQRQPLVMHLTLWLNQALTKAGMEYHVKDGYMAGHTIKVRLNSLYSDIP